jgi:hypothetical protein
MGSQTQKPSEQLSSANTTAAHFPKTIFYNLPARFITTFQMAAFQNVSLPNFFIFFLSTSTQLHVQSFIYTIPPFYMTFLGVKTVSKRLQFIYRNLGYSLLTNYNT